MASLADGAHLGRDMPGLDDATWARWWRLRGEHGAAKAPCCHVEGRGSMMCSNGSSEEELQWINWCRGMCRSGWRVIRAWRGGQDEVLGDYMGRKELASTETGKFVVILTLLFLASTS
uniref:Uncharacterized protein n=1 Tax=Oryza brachyantha TaxID=4533 RepID=J3MR69_ORYBR